MIQLTAVQLLILFTIGCFTLLMGVVAITNAIVKCAEAKYSRPEIISYGGDLRVMNFDKKYGE